MKKLFILFFAALLFSACSEDEIGTTLQFPNIDSFVAPPSDIGSILVIDGENFDPNGTYLVKFAGNVEGTITEITTTAIKVEIPQGAESGDITLTYNNATKVIGSIEIKPEINNEVYIFHESEKRLAKIDLATGDLSYIGSNITYGINTRQAVYHSGNNEYIGFEHDYTAPKLIRINLETGALKTVTIPSSFLAQNDDFSDLVVDGDDNLYIHHESKKQLAKINIETGDLSYIGTNITYGLNTRGAIYHATNNEYIGFENDFSSGPYLVRINVTTGAETKTTIPSSFLSKGSDFSDLAIDSNDNVYIFHDSEDKLAKIDLTTGNLTYIGQNIDYGINTRGAACHTTNNEYIGFENDFTAPYVVRINIATGAVIKTTIPSSFLTKGVDFSDIIVSK